MKYLPPDQYQRYMEYRNSEKYKWAHSGKKRFHHPEKEVVLALDAMTREIAEGKILE